MDAFLRFVTEPRYSAAWFVLALGTVYAVTPLLINLFVDQNPYMWKIGLLSGVAAVCVVVGFLIPVVDFQFGPNGWRLPISFGVLHGVIWGVFAIFLVVTLATAESIPLLSALKGGYTAGELTIQRAAFLKMRTGWEAGLGYVSAVLVTALLPYSLAALFVRRASGRFAALSLFLFYVESHLQKALFIQMVTPLFYLTAQRKIWNYYALVALVLGSAGLLYLNTVLARGVQTQEQIEKILQDRQEAIEQSQIPLESGGQAGHQPGARSDFAARELLPDPPFFPPGFFTAQFQPVSAMEHVSWRIAAVPIFTASDALVVFDKSFEGRPLWGATSSFVAATFGLERVNYDALVHGYQWGYGGLGRSNSVYVTDGYVNFGWAGVILFSLFIGQAFRWFWKSTDDAFRAMWPLFAYNVIQASLIGTLLSGGFILLFAIGLFLRVRSE